MKFLLSTFLLLISIAAPSLETNVVAVVNDPVFTKLPPLPTTDGPPMPPGSELRIVKKHEVLHAPKFKAISYLKTVAQPADPSQQIIQDRKNAIADMIVTNGPISMSEAAKKYYMPW